LGFLRFSFIFCVFPSCPFGDFLKHPSLRPARRTLRMYPYCQETSFFVIAHGQDLCAEFKVRSPSSGEAFAVFLGKTIRSLRIGTGLFRDRNGFLRFSRRGRGLSRCLPFSSPSCHMAGVVAVLHLPKSPRQLFFSQCPQASSCVAFSLPLFSVTGLLFSPSPMRSAFSPIAKFCARPTIALYPRCGDSYHFFLTLVFFFYLVNPRRSLPFVPLHFPFFSSSEHVS